MWDRQITDISIQLERYSVTALRHVGQQQGILEVHRPWCRSWRTLCCLDSAQPNPHGRKLLLHYATAMSTIKKGVTFSQFISMWTVNLELEACANPQSFGQKNKCQIPLRPSCRGPVLALERASLRYSYWLTTQVGLEGAGTSRTLPTGFKPSNQRSNKMNCKWSYNERGSMALSGSWWATQWN